jgi:tetratricopeptide (TPR) repeat protein
MQQQAFPKRLPRGGRTTHAVKLGLGLALVVCAAAPLWADQAQPAEAAQCSALKKKGDATWKACFQTLTRSQNAFLRAEGFWGIGDYRTANDVFRVAQKAAEKDPAVRTRWGRMYLDHYQRDDAKDLFQEALKLKEDYPPALVGMALVAGEQFEGQAIKFAESALKADPKLYEAQELIARVALEDSDREKAAAAARKAADIAPEALDGLAILATIDFLNDKADSPWMKRILEFNPKYGKAYAIAAHFFIINRRYDEGIAAYRKSLELDPEQWDARSDMGVNMMRLGLEDEARKQLEMCYNAGYQSPETVNSLRLLDSYKDYITTKTPNGNILRLHKKEANLLRPYFETELDRAVATYTKKYGFKLTKPVQVEVYPNHEDFAVRTVSMPGLGALGVTFGYVVAMDSPSARKPGQWHWAETLWHELSHVFMLEMTNHRVPRWFTEGLSTYEETAAGWGDRLDPGSIAAMKEKKLLPIAELDRGFMHPTYPDQVTVSYYQAGRILTFINEKWGMPKIVAMAHDFGDNASTPDVIRKELLVTPEEFDKQFMAWQNPQVEKTVNNFDDWRKRVRTVSASAKAKKWDEVITEGSAIRDLYPDYVEMGSIYEFLADAYEAKGDKAKMLSELETYAKIGGRDPETLKKLAKMQIAGGRKQEAVKTLEALHFIFLQDEISHQELGDLYMEFKNPNGAIREFGAVLNQAKPLDPAGAHYGLARAYLAVNRKDDAKEEVISALEAAPGLKPAQKLLLELSE